MIEPFITPLIWGVIIAVAAYPLYRRLRTAFGERNKLAATAFILMHLIWSIPVGLLDSILKPILLLGQGVKTPMAVIFIGAIGGLLSSGVIGLFIGAVILALGYDLFLLWLSDSSTKQLN